MKTTVVKPSNGKAGQNKARASAKSKPPSIELRRLTKRQREMFKRGFMWFFLILFTFSIVGGLIAIGVAKH